MYSLAICEDMGEEREALVRLCGTILDRWNVEHEISAYPSAEALSREILEGRRFDLLCLDILMEGKSGMELARELRQQDERVSILFITGSESYLREGYCVRPIQYLFKPVREEELAEALKTDLRLHRRPEKLSLRSGGKTVVLPLGEILFLESQNHNVVVRMSHGERFFRSSLSELERLLPKEQFCRCHNSFLVNFEHVIQIERKEVALTGGMRVPVSRGCYDRLQNQFVRYLNK